MASDPTQTTSSTRLGDVAPASSSADPDWTDQVTDMVVNLVDDVRDRTNGPVLKAARIAVYGVILTLVGLAVLLLVIIAVGRSLSVLPGDSWMYLAGIGVIFSALGSVLWTKRNAP